MSSASQSQTPGESEAELITEVSMDAAVKKRSSRACDHCRKTKNKCERPEDGAPCKSCAAAGIACTFLGPTHKRGPPKGYIHALEQRWYLAESILGAVLASPDPRAQSVVSTLRQDELAHEVLNKVDIGPFGSTGRALKSSFPTMEDLFYGEQAVPQPHGPARANRQSRVSREFVSFVQESAMTPDEVSQWRDRLANLLGSSNRPKYSADEPRASTSIAPQHDNPQNHPVSSGPPAQKRRLDDSFYGPEGRPDFSRMYTMDSGSTTNETPVTSDSDEGTEAFGQLSLDERQEIRYHGKASGLHLLGRNERSDDGREGGIWNFPLVRLWNASYAPLTMEEALDVGTPDPETQQRLLSLYFTYIHPAFPVIHKATFLNEYEASKASLGDHTRISKLLLLVIFAVSERIRREEEKSNMCDFLKEALNDLKEVFEVSRLTTCKALLLLGMHEIGIGSTEHAWLYIGMAVRMAEDLGLNCAGDNWRLNGSEMFSPLENQIRKRIWWACCIAESHICSFMGRPMSIGRQDSNVELPEINEDEDEDIWQALGNDGTQHQPIHSNISSCFRYEASLSMIVSDILAKIYPVRSSTSTLRRSHLTQLQSNLHQWYIDLPERLRYDKTHLVPPHVLVLHVQYWSAVLLLNRAFLPRKVERSSLSMQCMDVCQVSANHISTLVNDYREKFGLKCASPILIPHIQSAGIMHAVTLMLRKSNGQAYLGWSQCLSALDEMKSAWPSAQQAWQLLHGVKLNFDESTGPSTGPTDRQKLTPEEYLVQTPYDAGGSHGSGSAPSMGDMLGDHLRHAHFTNMGSVGQFYPGYEPLSTSQENPSWPAWQHPSLRPEVPISVPRPPGYQAVPDPSLVHAYSDRGGTMYIVPHLHRPNPPDHPQ